MNEICRYCHKKIKEKNSYVVLFKLKEKSKEPKEECAHLDCYTEQLISFIVNLSRQSIKLLQERGMVI